MADNESFIVQRFQRLSNLFYLMVGLPLLAFAWIYLNMATLNPPVFFEHPVYAWFWHLPVLLVMAGLTVGAYLWHRRQLKNYFSFAGKEQADLEEKMEVFYRVSMGKYLMLTGAVLLAVLSLYLSGHGGYTALCGVLLLIFSVSRPTPQRLGRELRLKKEEKETVKEELKQLR